MKVHACMHIQPRGTLCMQMATYGLCFSSLGHSDLRTCGAVTHHNPPAGLPPPPEKDAYLRSRLDRFFAEIKVGLGQQQKEACHSIVLNCATSHHAWTTPLPRSRSALKQRLEFSFS